MFPQPITQTDPDELFPCRDASQLTAKEQSGLNQSSRADADLAEDVDKALWNVPTLRSLDYNNIQIRVRNGMVGLYGHVASSTNRLEAEQAIRGLRGVVGIKDQLVMDDRLLAEVSTGLGLLEHTHACKFFTGVSHGVVMLSGTVEDAATRMLAEQYAASNPNVRGVINSVRVREGSADLPDVPFVQPAIGVQISFQDGQSGWIRQVIIDPDNRRVMAMTLQGRFANPWEDVKSTDSASSPSPERTLVIPMVAVRSMSTHSGSLNIRSTESSQYSEFNPAEFHTPPANWKPPHPYCPSDVLFRGKHVDAAAPIAVAMAHEILKDELLENDSLGG